MHVRIARMTQSIRSWELWTLPRPLLAVLLGVYGLGACAVAAAIVAGVGISADQLGYAVVAIVGVVGARMHAAWVPAETEHSDGKGGSLQVSADDCWLAALALGVPLGVGVLAVLMFQVAYAVLHRVVHRAAPRRWTPPGRPYRVAFNASSNVLAVAAAHAVFTTADGGMTFSGRAVVAAALAIGTLQAVCTSLLIVVLHLATGVGWRTLIARETGFTVAQLSQMCLGVLIWAAWASVPWSLVFVFPLLLSFERAQRHHGLLDQAQTDAKTGLPNLSYWQSRAETTLARNRVGGIPAAVLLVDLDLFKRVNDAHGHLVGDEVLIAAAERIAGAVRPADILGRFGGEEFVAFLSPASADEAFAVGERIRAAVSRTPGAVTADGSGVVVTCSVGIAEVVGDAPGALTDALERADLALYAAKEAGRDRVEAASPQGYKREVGGPEPRSA